MIDNIMEIVMEYAISYGVWASLFVGLLVYIIRETRCREKKYQDTIECLSKNLGLVEEIHETTKELRKELTEIATKAKK